jgi:acyl-CoA synthetase (AMP-forming)/AMP-acid ligase II
MSASTYWDKRIAVEEINGVPFRMYSDRPRRIEQLLAFADSWLERAYVIQGERTVTFEALRRASAAKARLLLDSNIGRGDRIFLLGWNGPDWILNFWACLRIGAIPVLANAWWREAEFSDALKLIQPAMILADRQGVTKIPSGAGWRTGPWEVDETSPGVDLPQASAEELQRLSENDPAAIIFTSGTQGKAKAVALAHRSLLSNQMMILHVTRKLPYLPDPSAGDVGLHTGPLFHIGGIHALVRAVLVGNTLVFGRGRFDAGEALDLIERYRIVRWSAVPTMATRVLEHSNLQKRDVSSLRAMTLGGSPVHPELFERIRVGLPSVQARIATGYGLSENGGQATTASGSQTARKPGTTGRPMPLTEIKTVPLPGLPDGEILVRSPTQMLRYYGIDESPIDPQGWLHTGDLGRLDQEGYVWITGRSKDIIIRGGENIAPAAVEEALAAVPGVTETAVFGMPHPELGEEVMAVVVVESVLKVEDLKTEISKRLASFAVPSLWHLQNEPLPVNQTGKVDKVGLRARMLGERKVAVAS